MLGCLDFDDVLGARGDGGCDGDGDGDARRVLACRRVHISETKWGYAGCQKGKWAKRDEMIKIDAQHPKATQVISFLRREV